MSLEIPEIPRRVQLEKNTEAEKTIRKAVDLVEEIGADPMLTNCVNLLDQAREILADYIDKKP